MTHTCLKDLEPGTRFQLEPQGESYTVVYSPKTHYCYVSAIDNQYKVKEFRAYIKVLICNN